MQFKQLNDKIKEMGFVRCTAPRTIADENGVLLKVFDYNHRKKYDVFSIYLDEDDKVMYAEYTKVKLNPDTQRFEQVVTKIENYNFFQKIVG